ncbi:MAG: biotin--[acetyl-CoA-carboxylase] ligase [Pseudomonadota bacterium]|nr:biotin--[acetyl-CoA-carboxylase] ligase [Pseudomonadota bacterium]
MNAPVPQLIVEEIDSTNAEARRRAEAGETGPLWIAARRQTAGRGRYGRTWDSAPQNLAATLLTTTAKPPAEAAQISFVAALAVFELAEAYVPRALLALKWPNDVLVDGAKVSGVLVESGPAGSDLWLAVGVGVNLASHPEETERPATHLGAHLSPERARPPSPEEALSELAGAFERWRDIWERNGFAPIRRAWTERAASLGAPVTARLGSETLCGVAEAMEADGALRLRLADGSVRRITAGDVFS